MYIRKYKIKAYGLIDTGATGGNFVDDRTAQRICEVEGISPIALSRPKPVKGYNRLLDPLITHAIYPRL
jgi:hypothetical protein